MSVVSAIQGLRDEIAARLNEIESDNTDIYNNWLNLSLVDISLSFPNAPFLRTSADFTLSSSTRVYTGLNLVSAEKINNITLPQTQTKLYYLPPEEFDILQPSATQGGMPTVWTNRGLLSNGIFEFYPVPGSSYTIHIDYQQQIGTVSAGANAISAAINFPPKYAELLILYAEKTGLRRQKRYDLVKQVDQDYQNMKQLMMQDLLRQTTQMPRFINVRELQVGQQTLITDPISEAFFGK